MLRFDPSRPGPDGKEKFSLAWSESGHPGGLGLRMRWSIVGNLGSSPAVG